MTHQQIIEKVNEGKIQTIGKMPVVVIPLKTWQALEEKFEDFEMAQSISLKKKIVRARGEKKHYGASETRKILGL